MSQSADTVVMVRPHHFNSNPETLADNTFQSASSANDLAQSAYREVTAVADKLRLCGVNVHVFDDTTAETPDSVFPNNWFSTHTSGALVLYPMFSKNRRKERRQDIIDFLQQTYGYQELIDLTELAHQGEFLEGTGAIVFDHGCKLAYACRSKRMSESALTRLCQRLGYTPVVFNASTSAGIPVYHTNVMMAVGTEFVMASVDMIAEKNQRREVIEHIEKSGKTLVKLTEQQISCFAGNTLELNSPDGKLLALSDTAYKALTKEQIKSLQQWVRLLPIAIPTIELGGGSVRCMLAQIFSPKTSKSA